MDQITDLFAANTAHSALLSLGAMLLATVLSLIITKVYQITFNGERYSKSLVHTIVMMAVVVSVVKNVLSDNAGYVLVIFSMFSYIFFCCVLYYAQSIVYLRI